MHGVIDTASLELRAVLNKAELAWLMQCPGITSTW